MKQTFEDFLMEKHAEEYVGTKDCIVDDFPDWLENLALDELTEFGDSFAKEQSKYLLKVLKEITECRGAYSEDRLEHARNTIRNMAELAKQAIVKVGGKNE